MFRSLFFAMILLFSATANAGWIKNDEPFGLLIDTGDFVETMQFSNQSSFINSFFDSLLSKYFSVTFAVENNWTHSYSSQNTYQYVWAKICVWKSNPHVSVPEPGTLGLLGLTLLGLGLTRKIV